MNTRSARLPISALPLLLAGAVALTGCGGGDSGTDSQAGEARTGGDPVRGAAVFKTNCAVCHGDTGHGDGIGAAALAVKPRNLTTEAYKYVDIAGSESEIAALVAYVKVGRVENGMPPFGHLPATDLAAVAAYVKSIRPQPNFVEQPGGADIGQPAGAGESPAPTGGGEGDPDNGG